MGGTEATAIEAATAAGMLTPDIESRDAATGRDRGEAIVITEVQVTVNPATAVGVVLGAPVFRGAGDREVEAIVLAALTLTP